METKRRQLYSELEEERERQSVAAAKQRMELDRERQRLEDFREASSETLTRDFESARAEAERRHEAELREAKERLAAEKEAWLETQMKRQQAWAMAKVGAAAAKGTCFSVALRNISLSLSFKEREVRDALKQERDRELERVVEELEKDRTAFREEIERSSESKLRRLREKLEAENAEFERSERTAMEKYNRIKAEMLETSGENEKLKVLLRQKEEETSEIRKVRGK